ncbi:glutathione S-transferase C-terminal domain-containing protein isoform X5 [Narcine bancroftii]|uniref:glutathione S-transferase C-terminal domain-containing protein isoform X5 n=1 Tax=Narcine bancroftii TaxID=1343680 RepID=UPI00383151AD
MKKGDLHDECLLYLELSHYLEDRILPLHTSIVLFLLSYCDNPSINVFFVPVKDSLKGPLWKKRVPSNIPVTILSEEELPPVVRSCRLPAVMERNGNFCRAGLAVVLRYIIQRACDVDSNRRDVSELLGFKKTCLKACAEVSQWTKLCEISIPLAVESFLRNNQGHRAIPSEILHLEQKLGEPVRVHNDDKIRRQKLKQWSRDKNKMLIKKGSDGGSGFSNEGADIIKYLSEESKESENASLELRTALSKLSMEHIPAVTRREQCCIRKVKSTDLPPLEHVFAEGLYFTLTDVVLFPCLHYFFENGISARFTPHPCPSLSQDWSNLPVAAHPIEGKLTSERALRKQQQLDNIISIVTNLAKTGDTIVDFCSGGGHLGIVLAHTLPSCQVILVENKEESLVRAKDRCDELGLQNIWFLQTNLDYFTGPFEIGVALHACGVATDMVIDHCIMAQAAFVICPCCYGFIQNTVKYTFPRSQKFKNVLSNKEHMVLCRFADQTAVQLPAERQLIGKKCMGLVDLDRSWAAEEHGYTVYVTSMEPDSCSPKNNLIVGNCAAQSHSLTA